MPYLALAMRNVLIIVDSAIASNSQPGALSGTTAQVVSALQQAILQDAGEEKGDRPSPFQQVQPEIASVQVINPAALMDKIISGDLALSNYLLCPLTLHLPETLVFPGQGVFQSCRTVEALRQTVAVWGYPTGEGNYWLPVVLTAKGPLYAEVIGKRADQLGATGGSIHPSEAVRYVQPIHFTDAQRQSLYELGYRLLRSLQATPSVYLMQFGYEGQKLWFDRLFPFPATPAIASLKVQQPDLFTCHWRCLTNQPLRELSISQAE